MKCLILTFARRKERRGNMNNDMINSKKRGKKLKIQFMMIVFKIQLILKNNDNLNKMLPTTTNN